MAQQKFLHIRDIMAICCKCDLSQKPKKGTLVTDDGTESVDFTLSPCTTHPEFFLRFRAYLMTICYCVIATPEFLSFEMAIDVCDFVFNAITCRADGRRPSLEALTSVYLAMFG